MTLWKITEPSAFREALKEFTHERAPRDNEAATHDLYLALYLLQERERK
jgi:hypothetical protein